MNDRIIAGALAAQRAGNLDEAARLCRTVLKSQPTSFEATYLLGFVLAQSGRTAEAERLIDRATQLNPVSADAFYNHGCLLQRLNRPEEAVRSFDRALTIKPGYRDALLNRGAALLMVHRDSAALTDFDRVLEREPALVAALAGRGTALHNLGRASEALHGLDRALSFEPDNPIALVTRATVLFRMGRALESIADLDRVLSQSPNLVEALVNRAAAFFEIKRLDEAIRDCAKAVSLSPDLPNLQGTCLHYRLHACDWANFESEKQSIAAGINRNAQIAFPFVNLFISSSPEDQLRCARIWINANSPPRERLWRGEIYRHRRIRVAYLSADFHAHATAHLMAGVFEHHDRSRFETIGFSYGRDDQSDVRRRLKAAFEHFVDVRTKSDLEVASLVRGSEADIAVDLKGLTRDARIGILATRPAPVQAHYLGYPGTTGAAYIDYILADPIVIPDEHRQWYSESVVFLPGSYQCNSDAGVKLPPAKSRAEYGLPETGIVFSCFNNNFKISPQMFSVWMRLLARVTGSVLWLMGDNATAERNLKAVAAMNGIAAGRLIFAPRTGLSNHLARQQVANIFLDTLPYGAHTTASDALRAGLPIVTCAGDSFAGRVAASLLHALGLPELISQSLDDYEALALKLASNPDYLRKIRNTVHINRMSSSLFDTERFTRNLESAFATMHHRTQLELHPIDFTVSDCAAASG